ncbi:MAG: cytochrome c-type biogenesis CcmF C-terminal domain-containing protein [Archaeoglobaceae archaeon]
MTDPGAILIWIAAILSAVSAVLFLISLRGRESLAHNGEFVVHGYTLALTFAFFLLLRYFIVRDFNVAYVYENADMLLSPLYTISAVWAGRAGSLLLWALFLALFNSVFISKAKKDSVTSLSVAISSLIVLFLSILLITDFSNPFTRLDFIPQDGLGLNPLLRTPEMAIHPPTIFLGYAGLTLPFAIAVAGLFYRQDWVKRAKPYLIFAWLFLSVGIFLGAFWSYKTLGWGGYWAWDPVENASLLPWLTASALIHGMLIEERKKSFKNLNFFLTVITFNLVILATFVTRSGIISSVHAFGQNPIGWSFLLLIVLTTLLALAVWSKRRSYAGGLKFDNLTREAMIFANISILLLATVTILIGTLAPLFFAGEITISREFYDRIEIPLGTALVVLLGLCAALNWRSDQQVFLSRSKKSLAAGVVTGIAVYLIFNVSIASLGAGILVFSLLNHLQDIKVKDLPNRRKIGGYLVHIGIILLFIGVMGSWIYETSNQNVRMDVGDSYQFGSLRIEFSDIQMLEDEQKFIISSTLKIYEDGELQGTLEPKQLLYKLERQNRLVSTVEILSQPHRDIYVAIGGTTEDFQGAYFEIYTIPLVSFVWIGSILMIVGGTYALVPRMRK